MCVCVCVYLDEFPSRAIETEDHGVAVVSGSNDSVFRQEDAGTEGQAAQAQLLLRTSGYIHKRDSRIMADIDKSVARRRPVNLVDPTVSRVLQY